eukprot:TRINITY_DN16833_c0_g1_i3.p1 TRINITY_DN16833_c0_g1~~TRINITY_DN16833_c0_g1_i3.p1  ORF type:complete len:421 (+),score=82.11 TRINITY_DN16833_c0_g1_i3:196-1458(+)
MVDLFKEDTDLLSALNVSQRRPSTGEVEFTGEVPRMGQKFLKFGSGTNKIPTLEVESSSKPGLDPDFDMDFLKNMADQLVAKSERAKEEASEANQWTLSGPRPATGIPPRPADRSREARHGSAVTGHDEPGGPPEETVVVAQPPPTRPEGATAELGAGPQLSDRPNAALPRVTMALMPQNPVNDEGAPMHFGKSAASASGGVASSSPRLFCGRLVAGVRCLASGYPSLPGDHVSAGASSSSSSSPAPQQPTAQCASCRRYQLQREGGLPMQPVAHLPASPALPFGGAASGAARTTGHSQEGGAYASASARGTAGNPTQEWRELLQKQGRKWRPPGDDRVGIGMYLEAPKDVHVSRQNSASSSTQALSQPAVSSTAAGPYPGPAASTETRSRAHLSGRGPSQKPAYEEGGATASRGSVEGL